MEKKVEIKCPKCNKKIQVYIVYPPISKDEINRFGSHPAVDYIICDEWGV